MTDDSRVLRDQAVPALDPSLPPAAGRWGKATVAIVSAFTVVALFLAYVRLSSFYQADSDGASNAIQAWQMLHGNWLLAGWTLSDVSFWTTELPQYMLVELAHGLSAGDIHVAAGMTYTLALAMAALVAAGSASKRVSPRTALLGAGIAAGIMLTPQLHDGLYVLLSSPDHIGTSVPMLLAWAILDRADPVRPRWAVTTGVLVLLTWAAVADTLVDLVALAPLACVCAFRIGQAVVRDRPAWRAALAGQRHEIVLGAGAVAAALVARGVQDLVAALGGFTSPAPTSHIAPLGHIVHHNIPVTVHGLLLLFGADFLDYPRSGTTILHLAGVALAVVGAAFAAWRFARDRDRVSQLLLVGIVINLVAFVASTKVAWLPTIREADVVLPFGAALAGRQLAPRITALPRLAAAAAVALLAVAGAGYAVSLVREVTPPVPRAQEQRLVTWLAAHDLRDGLSGYWQSNITTLTSGNQVRIREVAPVGPRVRRDGVTARLLRAQLRENDVAWYDPATNAADFVLLGPGTEGLPGFTDRAAAVATFGEPGRSYSVGPYTVLVWPHANLLAELPPVS